MKPTLKFVFSPEVNIEAMKEKVFESDIRFNQMLFTMSPKTALL